MGTLQKNVLQKGKISVKNKQSANPSTYKKGHETWEQFLPGRTVLSENPGALRLQGHKKKQRKKK